MYFSAALSAVAVSRADRREERLHFSEVSTEVMETQAGASAEGRRKAHDPTPVGQSHFPRATIKRED